MICRQKHIIHDCIQKKSLTLKKKITVHKFGPQTQADQSNHILNIDCMKNCDYIIFAESSIFELTIQPQNNSGQEWNTQKRTK